MVDYLVKKEYQGLIDAYEKAGGNRIALLSKDTASLLVHENNILNATEVEGVKLTGESQEHGIKAELLIEEGRKVIQPIHLCFGILPEEGRQEIVLQVDVKPGAEVSVIAHCIFPNAIRITHKMDAVINIADNARFSYKETHYHGDFGGIEVIPKATVRLGKKAQYENTFSLIQGSVGTLDFNYEVFSDAGSIAGLLAKVYGKNDDVIKIAERIHLNGNDARSLIKTRIVLRDRARAEVIGETYGNAPFARGHVDCIELVDGKQAIAKAIPIVQVRDAKAKVTHEAAIGSIDRRQVETLMARGLEESEAIDVIVKGILR